MESSTHLKLNLSLTGTSSSILAVPVALPYDKPLEGPITDYALLTFGSVVNAEYPVRSMMLPAEGYQIEETSGRSTSHNKPWWFLYNIKTHHGVGVALAYSGNWKFEIKPRGQQVSIHLDTLPAGLSAFEEIGGIPIPGALTSEFTGGWDYGAQPIVRYIRTKLLRDLGPDWPWVQYNTWYGTQDLGLTEEIILAAIPKAAAVGCELFTVDAGWYGINKRTSFHDTLGDWKVNPERLPRGLKVISDAVHQAGMKFGLWFEIECASKDSEVAKDHPGWFIHDASDHKRYRMIFDLTQPEVLNYLKDKLDVCITDFSLDYIKMDLNTPLTFEGEKNSRGNDLAYDHVKGLLSIWRHLREKHPQLAIENCAGGSHRQDVTQAGFTDTHWVSDNVDNHANLMMNYSYSYLFPPEMCSHWTVKPDANDPFMDIETQFTVNMLGHFGISGAIWEWDETTTGILTERIALYKKIRPLIRRADVYHLTEQVKVGGSIQAVLYVDSVNQQAIIFAFQAGAPSLATTLKLPGLQPDTTYRIIFPVHFGGSQVSTGQELLDKGMALTFPTPGSSAIIQIQSEGNCNL